ncbi:MAG: hypothetical protein J6Q48_01455 [Bacteroidaceae bacterium]|nr:hypothetical protein [Bacteroidaceae bacterium]
MSAQIPETMLVSDLLKSTGYDCPEEAVGKTMAELISGGDVKVSTNTDAEIDVSQYTEPVVINPAEGYDATKKVTVELKNIPAAGATLYAWKLDTAIVYTKVAEPTTSDKALVPASTGLAEAVIAEVAAEFASITISTDEYTRYDTGDITL